MDRPQVEIWFRNPRYYLEQLAEVGATNLSWDAGYVARRKIKLWPMLKMYFGQQYWRSLVIDSRGHATLYDSDDQEVKAVWPSWSCNEPDWSKLANYVKYPWGESLSVHEQFLESSERPRAGQAHVVVITDVPDQRSNKGKNLLVELSEIQEMHPEVKFFLHGTFSYRALFGLEFTMGDIDARERAKYGQIFLPTGRKVEPQDIKSNQYWLHIFGKRLSDIETPQGRCIYNIQSALWAGTYYKSLKRFGIESIRLDNPQLEAKIKENNLIYTKHITARAGDRVACDDCSLWLHCKYFREGAVCAVPNTDMSKVAEMFGTRDSESIITGLGKLLQVQTQRAESAILSEDIPKQGVDPNVTKLMDSIFKNATDLLKLNDPAYRTNPGKVDISISTGGGQVMLSPEDTQRQLAANAVQYLEDRGYKREEITAEMVQTVITEMMNQQSQKAIPGEAS